MKTWYLQFLSSLCRFMASGQENRQLSVERIELFDGRLVTVLRVPASNGRLFCRVINLRWLEEQFVPNRASTVADAWFLTIYPPHPWDDLNVINDVCWFNGESA
ncbi:MAG: hypothetical protein ACREP9_11760 [Candidatus Dormibacteraceae bacterium]